MKNKIIIGIFSFFIFVGSFIIVLAYNVEPLQLKRDCFIYEYGKGEISTDVAYYINANENVVNSATLNLDNVKSDIGLYPANIVYLGVEYPFYIKIVDTTKPVVKLKQVQINAVIAETIAAIDLVESVDDNSDIIAYFKTEDENKTTSKTYNETGSFIENIIVEDSSGNQSAMLRVKIVVETANRGAIPTFSGIDNTEIIIGDKFDVLQGVSASDGKGNDITDAIKILKNNVNINKVGTYEVIYSVTNASGNTNQKTRKIIVVDKSNN